MLKTESLLSVDKIPIAHPIEQGRIIYNDSLLPQKREVNSELPFKKKNSEFHPEAKSQESHLQHSPGSGHDRGSQ